MGEPVATRPRRSSAADRTGTSPGCTWRRHPLAWEREQAERHDWLDGDVFGMAGASLRHAALTVAVGSELVRALGAGSCRVFSSDLEVAARPRSH